MLLLNLFIVQDNSEMTTDKIKIEIEEEINLNSLL